MARPASLAADRRAIYVNVPGARNNLAGHIDTIKKCRFNAIVIDMKDDFGCLYFPTATPPPWP